VRVAADLSALNPQPVLSGHMVKGDLRHERHEANETKENKPCQLGSINLLMIIKDLLCFHIELQRVGN